MIESLVSYPLDSMELDGGLNVLAFADSALYLKIVSGLYADSEDVVLGRGDKVLSSSKEALFVGDPAVPLNADTMFLKTAVKKLIDGFDSSGLSSMRDLYALLKSKVLQQIWELDLPISLSEELDVKTVIAGMRPRIESDDDRSFYGRILQVIQIAGALGETRMLVMLHITQYCNKDQLGKIHAELLRQQLQMIDLECVGRRIDLDGGRSHYVDKDYVQFP